MRAGTSTTTRITAAIATAVLTLGLGVSATPTPAGAADPDGDRCFILAAHVVFLDRPASPAETTLWAGRFLGGTPRSDLPDALANSDEWLSVVVDGLYRQALDRPADDAGRTYWIGELRRGALVNRVASLIYGSAEFYARAGGTADGYIRQLYTRILHRPADTAGLTYWRGQVATRGRGAVAAAFFASVESRGDRVDTLYADILGRPADSSGRAYWIDQLARVNDVRLAVLLASSAEFYARAPSRCSTTERLADGNDDASGADISADGRYVAFQSAASNLVPGDTNGRIDVFVRDRVLGTLTMVSRTDSGGPANGHSYDPQLSLDGDLVYFTSDATNLAPISGADTNGRADIFGAALNLPPGTAAPMIRFTGGNGDSTAPAVSEDGNRLVFQSTASDLVPGDTNGRQDIFRIDPDGPGFPSTPAITRLAGGNGDSSDPSISDDGSVVVFDSSASDLSGGDTNGQIDVFQIRIGPVVNVRSRITGGSGHSFDPVVSGNGSVVAYASSASDLVPGDTNGTTDIFVRGTTTRRLTNGNGQALFPDVSDDGRHVTFESPASNLVPGDTNLQVDVFRVDTGDGRIVRVTDGNGQSSGPSISGDGSTVAFRSSASDLVEGDTNGATDVFAWTYRG